MKSFLTHVAEMKAGKKDQYASLQDPVKSIYNRQGANMSGQAAEPTDAEVQQAANRKAQVKYKIIDNA